MTIAKCLLTMALALLCAELASAHCVETSSSCLVDGGGARSPNERVLGDFVLMSAQMTRVGCMNVCHGMGKKLAGVENGKQCMCGDAAKKASPSKKCSFPCTGNHSASCGGSWAIDIISFTCAGPPDPTPSPTALDCRCQLRS